MFGDKKSWHLFSSTSPIHALVSAYMRYASHSHILCGLDFSLTPLPRPGIELTAVQLHLFEGLYIGTLNRLNCLSCSNSWLLEIEVLSANFRTRVRARARRSLRRSTPTQRTSGRRWLTGSPRGEPSTRRTGTPINCGHRWSAS